MAYDEKLARVLQVGAGAAYTLSSTGVAAYNFLAIDNVRVMRFMAYVTTAIVSTAPVVVQLIRRPVYGSTTNQVIIGTLQIPGGTVVDTIVYKDIIPAQCLAGDQFVFNTSTAATSSGAALFDFIFDYDPETAPNQTKYLASA